MQIKIVYVIQQFKKSVYFFRYVDVDKVKDLSQKLIDCAFGSSYGDCLQEFADELFVLVENFSEFLFFDLRFVFK